MDTKLLAQWSINIITLVFIIGHLVRSVKINKGFSDITIKMYLSVFVLSVVANLTFAGLLDSTVLNSSIFAAIGFIFGTTFTK